jgi:NADH-quinone oxidoreductase subunit J
VGAVAVLFLFVLMMLNIKIAELLETNYNVVPFGVILGILFIYQLLLLLRFEFDAIQSLNKTSIIFLNEFSNASMLKLQFFNLAYSFSNVKMLGLTLFSDFLFHFLVAGLVLLLSMLAAIVLTLQKNFISKSQNVYNQILTDFNFAIKLSN